MKFIVSILLIALLGFTAGIFLPWWSIALGAFLVSALIPLRPGIAFLSGFIAIFILWGLLAWNIDMSNGSILSVKIAQLMHLGGSPILLILVTALVGALVGGSASLTGSFLKKGR